MSERAEDSIAAAVGLTHVARGKVRELYATADGGQLVMVASDRISAFDFVLDTPIPDKGRVLTAMSVWWFATLRGRLGPDFTHHLLGFDGPLVPAAWRGRAMVCEPLTMLPVEAVARGYLAGSGLLDYQASGTVCGIALPTGLVDGSPLPEPIFTPASKAEVGGHDENVTYAAVEGAVGAATAAALREQTLAIYRTAGELAAERGILLADTKFEFGRRAGEDRLVLGDEVLTPDSSRFWPADDHVPGRPQPSFDKQFVRNWLLSPASGWDRHGGQPPPPLPDDVVAATRARYIEAYERLTGRAFADWPGPGPDTPGQ